ncbi:ribonuclease H-like protein [Chloropicon primus]|uniref:3'-5' exonuclease n=1 Tax=Chloropicon primus TaxID=1764295 RepID=A0A5B8MJ89_9CHLO|nr:ribonuclease H-like protein [Chloropicon primus]UPQ99768.1 ribonuclease H-like protein [Chloropicon primus]|mmetsp:Transcript_2960/g.8000  ORF Transcript_2960/g.8000 Transcript_2960/m.8000 type:complete len:252 (+) Transcript_2960:2984-3739(+)|eukprot:QDZ20556.1 ribonuclease H-like protein [Chloropicon primus]
MAVTRAQSKASPLKRRQSPRGRALPSTISKKKKAIPKLLSFKGRYLYLKTRDEVEAACKKLLESAVTELGFDMEWRVLFKKGPENIGKTALLQFCFTVEELGSLADLPWRYVDEEVECKSSKGVFLCFLLHIHHSGLSENLVRILTSDQINKYGVNIGSDVIKLAKDTGVRISNAIDVCHLASQNARIVKRYGNNKLRFSLNDLSMFFLNMRMDKDARVRLGNWEREDLDYCKIKYACSDAYASLKVARSI